MIAFILAPNIPALENELFSQEQRQLEESVSDDTLKGLEELGADSVESIISGGVDGNKIGRYISDTLAQELKSPLSSLIVLIVTIIICSVAEGYTHSLRYTETADIMGTAVSLFIASAVLSPITGLLGASAGVIQGASSLMMMYLPIMAGMLAFSGHSVSSAGYFAAITGMGELISWLCADILLPVLHLLLSLSICSGVSRRVNLRGISSAISNAFKWGLTFAMSVYVAVIGLNGALSNAADGIAEKAAKFTLSSLIPLVGSSISEAYGAVRGSVGILRSGMGVFVILAICVGVLPVLLRCALWSAAIFFAKLTAEALGVGSAASVLNSLSSFMAALRALIICVTTAFILSSAVMMRIGGGS